MNASGQIKRGDSSQSGATLSALRNSPGRFTFAALLVGLLLLLFSAPAARAQGIPPGCTGSGIGITLFTSAPDVHVGDTICYGVLVFNGTGGGPISCDATNIQAWIVTPDGATNNITLLLVRTTLTNGQWDYYPSIVCYVVRAQDILPDGTVRATARDTGIIQQNDIPSTGGSSQGVNTRVVNELDKDGDGLSDYDELFVYGTNPLKADTDDDGIPDKWEVDHGLNPLVNDATQIGPAGVSNLQIYQYDTNHVNQLDPHNPFFAPGTSIYEALNNGQHTNRYYYDHDDRLVGAEYSRGISLAYTYDGNSNLKRQTVLSRANETNGLPVLWQFLNGLTNSANSDPYADSDGDGWSNYQEWLAGTDPNNPSSAPTLTGNPGANIASLTLPFTPSNFVVGVGQLDGVGAEEIVIGADGNPGTNMNSLLVLTQTFTGWSTQRVDIGFVGVTSIAVGQLTNRPAPAIYLGLRGITNGSGRVMEFASSGGIWQSNSVVLSTNKTAFVLGVRGQDLLVSCGTTNTPDGSLSVASFSTNWNLSLMDTNSSHRGLGTLLQPQSQTTSAIALRLLDSGGIAAGTTQVSALVSNLISYWKLDGNSSDVVSSNNGSDTSITYSSANGKINSGAGFSNPSNSKIALPNLGLSVSRFNPRSIELWFKATTDNPKDWRSFFVYGSNSSSYDTCELVQSALSSGAISWGFDTVSFDTSSSSYNAGSWVHLVAVYDGGSLSTSTVHIYINGSSVSLTQNGVSGIANTPDSNYSIGASFIASTRSFDGDIDEVGIWSRALSAVEVSLLYGNGNGKGYGAPDLTALLLPEPQATNRYLWRGQSLTSGLNRSGQTNGSSIFYVFGDDVNGDGHLDAGDDFVAAEYMLFNTNATLTTLSRQHIASLSVAQSYGLASVNFLNSSNEVFFTGEPDGQVFAWTATGATNPLQRQMFSAQYLGKAWHALASVKTLNPGEGLAGLSVDPTNRNTCNVIFWPPQLALPQPASIVETAPSAAVIPSANPLGSNAVVTVRLWDNEGNASTPFLQYQILGSTNWQNATLTILDGAYYNSATRVAALPGGSNHLLTWNALADLGANVVTNILLRARAQDFMLVGDWSQPTPFQINTSVNVNPTNPPVSFTGIARLQGGMIFNWQVNTNVPLYLQRSPALSGSNAIWVNILTAAPPFSSSGSFTDSIGTNLMEFYRFKIGSP